MSLMNNSFKKKKKKVRSHLGPEIATTNLYCDLVDITFAYLLTAFASLVTPVQTKETKFRHVLISYIFCLVVPTVI